MIDKSGNANKRAKISIFDEIKYQVTQISNIPDTMKPEPEANYQEICTDIFGEE